MKGPLHTVGAEAENDGLLNTYFLYSGDNAFEVTTGVALRIRIRELYAIDQLRGMSKTEEFTKAMTNAGKQKLENVAGIVRNPSARSKACLRARHAFLAGSVRAGKAAVPKAKATRCKTLLVFRKRKSLLQPNSASALTRPIRICRSSS